MELLTRKELEVVAEMAQPRPNRFSNGWARYKDGSIGIFFKGNLCFKIPASKKKTDPYSKEGLKKAFKTNYILGAFSSKEKMKEELVSFIENMDEYEE